MNEKKYIIEVSHVNKSFKNNKVLKDVTLRCESGGYMGWSDIMALGKRFCLKQFVAFWPVMKERFL